MTDRVVYTIEDGVADVKLNRADKMNAIDSAMFEGIIAVGKEISEIKSLRAVVLSGEGRAFCAGLDFSSFQAMAGAPRERSSAAASAFVQDGPANRAQMAGYVWALLAGGFRLPSVRISVSLHRMPRCLLWKCGGGLFRI